MPMRGLTIIVAGDDPARFDAALTLANAQAALGGRVRLYLHDRAVTLALAGPLAEAARELGVQVIACQTALDTHGAALPPGAEGGGMIGLLADLGEDRLVTI
ncbi:DsrE family protein [Sphingomonas sp.]|uniref:DsrE family protein n=1 Tax=Sphingomonas sp. TaxID=28214 RepID=UPI002DD651EA|nr:DsrE family protein [Sphingomonas sp.]